MAKGQKKQKGGRDQRLDIRVTPEEKEMIRELASVLFPTKNADKCRTDAIIYAVKSLLETEVEK